MKGKPWKFEEESRLRALAEEGLSAQEIGSRMNKKPHSIYEKARRMGLAMGISRQRKKALPVLSVNCISDHGFPGDSPEKQSDFDVGCVFRLSPDGGLPSVEEALKVLVAAADRLATPGLAHDETLRLRTLVGTVKTYKEMLADFLNYKELEKRMVELEAKYLELLAKTKNIQR